MNIHENEGEEQTQGDIGLSLKEVGKENEYQWWSPLTKVFWVMRYEYKRDKGNLSERMPSSTSNIWKASMALIRTSEEL